MSVSGELGADFARDGYVVLRAAVPAEEVDAARALIDRVIAGDRSVGALPRYTASSFCPEHRNDARLLAPYQHLIWAVRRLLAGGEAPAARNVQVALRFPEHRAAVDRRGFHLDGFPAPGNTVPEVAIRRHTLLAGVFLSRVDREDAGALMVWPGSHRVLADAIAALDPAPFLAARNPAALLARIEAFEIGEPVQLFVEPGDAVLVHHLVAHAGAPNLTLQVRYALYYRLQHSAHAPDDARSLVDPTAWFADIQ